MAKYISINPFTHLIINSIERKQTKVEFVYTTGGSLFEKDKDRGRKHLLEHCIASRTKNRNFQEFKDYSFEENLNFNAYTSPMTMGLTGSGHYMDLGKIIDIILEMAFTPTFDQEILDREKEVVLREIAQRRGEANYRLFYEVAAEIFEPGSKSIHEVLGDPTKVEKTKIQDFENLMRGNLQDGHLVMMVSGGGINQAEIIESLESRVKKIHTNLERKKIDFDYPNRLKSNKVFKIISPLAHEQVELSLHIPVPVNVENQALRSVFEFLMFKHNGFLYDHLRDEKRYIYAMHADFDNSLQQLGLYFTCQKKFINKILTEVEDVFANFDKYFRAKKLDDFLNLITKKQEIAADTLQTTTSFTYETLVNFGQVKLFDDFVQEIRGVSLEDIKHLYNIIHSSLKSTQYVMVSSDKSLDSYKLKLY